jgi:peptide/nickel transport system substrate-binding protein
MQNRLNPIATVNTLNLKDVRAVSKLLAVGIVIVVLIVAGVAAGYYYTSTSPKSTPTPSASESPTASPAAVIKDTIAMGTTDSVETCLDPAKAYDFFGWEIIQALGSPLVEYAAGTDSIVPSLATSWTVTDDGLHWTFNLRQGVHYPDGREFTADDVKFTFDRNIEIADPDGPFVGIGFGDIIDNIQVVSPFVVQFNLKIPFAAFLSLMASQCACILDSTYAPKAGATWAVSDDVLYVEGNARASNPMGLGPYLLKTWVRTAGKDTSMQLEANPNYWNASGGYPKTANINIQFFADQTALALAITSGDVDIAFRQLSTTDIKTMQQNSALKVWEGTGAFIQYLCMQENAAPFNDVVIRRAIASAIDRDAIVQTVFQGQAQALYSMIPAGMFGHTEAFQAFGAPNYTMTKELLATKGYNTNNKLSFTLWYETSGHYPSSEAQALVLKDSLEASGVITVTLEGLDWAAYKVARTSDTMQAYIMGWYPDYIDPDDYIYPFLQSSGGSWLHINYASAQMDQLIAWARGNTTQSVRESLYSQISELCVADCPLVPLYQSGAYAVTKTNVGGVFLDITQQWRNWLVYAEG